MFFLIKYNRRTKLEVINGGLIIIDVDLEKKYQIINLYRLFNTTNGRSQRDFFTAQLSLIRKALEQIGNRYPIVLEDFNLDENQKYNAEYWYKVNAK